MRSDLSPVRPSHPRGQSGAALLAALLLLLLGARAASAQALTYGPILGRGYTAAQTIVRWGTSDPADATTVAYRKRGATTWELQSGAAARDHEIVLTGLDPGETYEYEVRSLATPGGAAFTTCPLPGRAMDFVFYGDSRTGFGTLAGEHAKLFIQVARRAPEMIFESGDIAPIGLYEQYLQEFFPVTQDLVKSTPFMAVPGNHDAVAGLANNYALLFPTPRPAGTDWQSYYSFTCGNALFIGLDSNRAFDDAQVRFLSDRLQAGRDSAAIDHVFVWMHHSSYSVGLHGDSETVQAQWLPLLNRPENKVTAVFSGHDHIYARMDDGSGVFYVVSGGAGANLYPDTGTSKARRVYSRSVFNFVTIHLAGQAMSAVAYDDTGTEIDRFSTIKNGVTADLGPGGVVKSGCNIGVAGSGAPGGVVMIFFLGCALLARRRGRELAQVKNT